jgi:4-diphosphocytidyl-2C-methyl-D-erythritol kinase
MFLSFATGDRYWSGRGEIIEPVHDIAESFMLVVATDVAVPTAEAYRGFDASRLTNEAPESILRVCRFMAESGDLAIKR